MAAFFERNLSSAAGAVVVHGSAALGGWTSASDLDVLVTTTATGQDWVRLGAELLAELAPTPVVELSVVTVEAAAQPEPPWPFLLHVNQQTSMVGSDGGQGDPDLLMHYVVASCAGVTISGFPASRVFGPVPRTMVLGYLHAELGWALAEADQRYAVLNACRALAYAEDGLVLSKMGGGAWALAHGLEMTLVESALTAQAAGCDLGRPTPEAQAFVGRCRAALDG